MSKTKQKVQLNRISRDKVNLSSQSILTARCITLHPTLCHEVVPGDSFNVNMEQFNRVDALPVSSFVQLFNRNVAFYVKNCQVWKPYDAYKTGAPYAFGYQNVVPTKKPYFSVIDFTYFLIYSNNLCESEDITTRIQDEQDAYHLIEEHEFDFILLFAGEGGSHFGYTLNERGRVIYKIFYQLGYRLPSVIDFSQTALIDQYLQLEMSLLPLMSYLSVLVNYYVPLKWRTYSFVNSMSYLVDPVPQHFQTFNEVATEDYLNWRLSVINLLSYIYYGDDYFTSAQIEPFRVDTALHYNTISDPANVNTGSQVREAEAGQNGEPVLYTGHEQDSFDSYSQYLIYALSCVTGQAQLSAMTLNDVKAATLAKFGYKAETADMVPYILEKKDATINVSPEISTADTLSADSQHGAPIGYKAGTGQGFSKLSGHFKFDNYGILLFVNSIMPNYFYYQGIRRSLLRVAASEEFDRNYSKLGYQGVAKAELNIDIINPMANFGFVRKYGDMAQGNNVLGGDFVINTLNEGLDAFHFGRKVLRSSDNNEAFSLAITGRNSRSSMIDGQQFNRIFVNTDSDPIQQWYIWDIKATRPIESQMTVGDADGEVVETKPIGATLNE